ncbi:efflux RND transporter periplasmic adaptor subunit [Psychromonas sp.]|nr:efflux RND transporter periplasmic adaptor subunit [Psychromonas sp.]
MLSRVITFITLRPYIVAVFITALLLFWMLAPVGDQVPENSATEVQTNHNDSPILPTVQTTHYVAKTVTKNLNLYGKSEANSRSIIRAEVPGKIIKMSADKGAYVKRDQKIAHIEKSELPARLKQAEANLTERELTYKAVKSLNDKGLQGRVRLAEVNSLLLSAQTDVEHLQLSLQRTDIIAPFSGVLQEQFADLGDYLQVGDPIFSLENINPIVIRGDATEHHINHLKLGQKVSATLLSGEKIEGEISYIASMADSGSSTFRIEAKFPNPNMGIFSGISAKLTIPLYQVDAIYVSPSTLALDENGNLGVKIVKNGVVAFHAIELVEADNDGAWLSGFDNEVDIITLGQGFVKAGAQVNAVDKSTFKEELVDNNDSVKSAHSDAISETELDKSTEK